MKALLLGAGAAIILSLPFTAQAADDVTCASYNAMAPHDQMAAVASMHQERSGTAAMTGSMSSHDPMANGKSMTADGTGAAMADNDTMSAGGMAASHGQMAAQDSMAAPNPATTQSAMNDSNSMAGGMSSKAMAMQVMGQCNAHPESTLRRIFDELF